MKRFKHALMLLVLLSIMNIKCTSEKTISAENTELKILHIDPTKINSADAFKKIVADIEFIPLETKNCNSLDWVRKLWVSDSNFFILTGSQEVLAYNLMGKFRFRKGREGKGKNEIHWLKDFCPGKDGGINILGYKEYYQFDRNGNFISAQPLILPYEKYNPGQFHIINDTIHLFSTSTTGKKDKPIEEYSLYLMNQFTKNHRMFLRRYTCNVSDNTFFQCNEDFLIAPVIGIDSIYRWADNHLVPFYYVDFGNYKITSDELPVDQSDPQPAFNYAQENNKCLHISTTLMNDDWLTFTYLFHNYYYRIMYNHASKNYIIIEYNKKNTQDIVFMTSPLAVYENKFISSIPAYRICDLLKSNSIDLSFLPEKRRHELIDKLKNVKETDNPVLMIITTKNN